MLDKWISLEGFPAEGRELAESGQEIWSEGIKNYGIPARIDEPLTAKLRIMPSGDGCLVSGELAGTVILVCDRCAEEFKHPVKLDFELYEQPEGDDGEPGLVRDEGSGLELNLGALLWEQFVMGLPVHSLCSPACKGLCPSCGGT